jgi:hypothetical protein
VFLPPPLQSFRTLLAKRNQLKTQLICRSWPGKKAMLRVEIPSILLASVEGAQRYPIFARRRDTQPNCRPVYNDV